MTPRQAGIAVTPADENALLVKSVGYRLPLIDKTASIMLLGIIVTQISSTNYQSFNLLFLFAH
jgi:hypothetical protein